ncbi:hypothetical protein F0562_033635 [Nyssa sinensis]|uniref:Uncharacterized protein n=1 Tax=Nyssa sinensis TaxID=561372 RepID=A0A5J5AIF9_9ASTE|nr:hypothetical protein F0562_033635 [Nyssa sinensis]
MIFDIVHVIQKQFCNEFTVPKDKLEHFKNVTPQDIVCSQRIGGTTLLKASIFSRITRAMRNSQYCDGRISHLLPSCYQDMIVRVYSKKPELVEAVSDAFGNFQVRTYGMKAQVHETPEKKKRRRLISTEV